MKKAFAFLSILLLLLSGCSDEEESNVISVDEVICPYEINHKENVVEIVLKDSKKSGILWQVEMIPDDVCAVSQESIEESTCRFLVTGKIEGAAQLEFSAKQEDETVIFVLTLMVNVDSEGKVAVSSYQHREREDNTVKENGLNYKWNVDVDGVLNFSFINKEDRWSVQGDGDGICTLSNVLSMPAGCKFSSHANMAGQTTMVLVGETSEKKINVVIEVDQNGDLKVISVQEQ